MPHVEIAQPNAADSVNRLALGVDDARTSGRPAAGMYGLASCPGCFCLTED
jgi:hypothetical protein